MTIEPRPSTSFDSRRTRSRLCSITSALLLFAAASSASAQSGGGGGGSGGGASGGGAASGAGSATGAAAGRSGGDAGARSGAARQSGTSSSGGVAGTIPNPALNPNPAAPGQSAVPSPIPGSNQSATPGSASGQGDLNAPEQGRTGARATNRGGMPDPTPNTQRQPNSPIDQSAQKNGVSSGGSSRREGAASNDMTSCMNAWDAGTHMTKTQWRRVCSNTLSYRNNISK